jgi:hypothetical protein
MWSTVITMSNADFTLVPETEQILVMVLVVWGIARLLLGLLAIHVAERRGRSPAWFLGGLFLGTVGVVLPWVLPNLKQERHRRQQVLALARTIDHVNKRLNALAAYLEERNQKADLEGEEPALELPPVPEGSVESMEELLAEFEESRKTQRTTPPPPHPPDASKRDKEVMWFYREDGEKRGPVVQYEMKRMLREEEITPNTLVWAEGMESWRAAFDVPDLLEAVPEE